jgi:hypothetical protein
LALSLAFIPCIALGQLQWSSGSDTTARYDSNVELTPKGESDMVYSVGSRLGIKYLTLGMGLGVIYRVNAELFQTHSNLNRVSQDLSIDTDFGQALEPLTTRRTKIRIKENIYYTPVLPNFESLLAPPSDATTGGIRTPRTTTLRNVFEIIGSRSLSILTDLDCGYKNIYTRYKDPALIDSQTNEVRIGFLTKLSRTDSLTAHYSYSRFSPYGGEITHIHSFTIGEEHAFSRVLTGNAAVGETASVRPDLDRPQYSVHGSLSMTRRFKDEIQLYARVQRSVETGSGISSSALLRDSGSVSLSRQFTPALSANIRVDVYRNYSIGGLDQNGDLIDVHSQGAGIGLHYQFTTWLTSDLAYDYSRQETVGSFKANMTRNQYSFSLRAQWS